MKKQIIAWAVVSKKTGEICPTNEDYDDTLEQQRAIYLTKAAAKGWCGCCTKVIQIKIIK